MTTVRKGQALIIILVVMSISLVLGVAVSSRAISTLRQISFSDQAATALAFAEGGAEDGLKYLKDCLRAKNCTIPYDPDPVDLDDDGLKDFDYKITSLGDSNVFDLPPIKRDRTVEVDLIGYEGRTVYVHWVDKDNRDETDDPPALEMTIIYCGDPSCSSRDYRDYGITREAADPEPGRRSENGFSAPAFSTLFHNGVNYNHVSSITFPSGKFPASLRLKFLYSEVSAALAIEAETEKSLPIQGSRIESWGFSGRVVRKVEVTRTANALSELFDYVLFTGSESVPLRK